ncbi:MAG: Rpn family recombination-promoting nuclease/putative transposase [Methylococcaceae bacterium]|jgi:predicted transposase/invertase (TIGR01784 family)
MTVSKYVNPYTDFGFKKLFGEEACKDLLIDFLNQLLPDNHQIKELSFKNPENVSDSVEERKAVFDIFCESTTGEKFIVEMQKAKMQFFKDRSLFYSTFPIKEQAKKGVWDFKLLPVYLIAILDFKYDEREDARKFRRDVCLKDQDGDVFYDKLHFKFLQMPLFDKQEHELACHFEKWAYFLKHLEDFEHIPSILNEPIFQHGFEVAEVAKFTSEQYDAYLKSIAEYSEAKATLDTAFLDGEKQGLEKGKAEGKIEGEKAKAIDVAKTMLTKGFDVDTIAEITQLQATEIEALKE